MTKTKQLLIAGCGDLGTRIGLRCVERGWRVFGLRRNPGELPEPIEPIAADLTALEGTTLPGVDRVAITVSAPAFDEETYRRTYIEGVSLLLDHLRGTPDLLFTSSTSVYAQTGGEWVDETSPTGPTHFSGRTMLEAEVRVRAAGGRSCILRLAGLYGPGRTRLLDRVRAGWIASGEGGAVYSNRIHVEDAAGAAVHLLSAKRGTSDSLRIGVDHEPAPLHDVTVWLARKLGVEAEPGEASSGRRRRSNKRCSNSRLLQSGYRFRYPSFREGYGALLQETEA